MIYDLRIRTLETQRVINHYAKALLKQNYYYILSSIECNGFLEPGLIFVIVSAHVLSL